MIDASEFILENYRFPMQSCLYACPICDECFIYYCHNRYNEEDLYYCSRCKVAFLSPYVWMGQW
jgi:hypothetical protein